MNTRWNTRPACAAGWNVTVTVAVSPAASRVLLMRALVQPHVVASLLTSMGVVPVLRQVKASSTAVVSSEMTPSERSAGSVRKWLPASGAMAGFSTASRLSSAGMACAAAGAAPCSRAAATTVITAAKRPRMMALCGCGLRFIVRSLYAAGAA